MNRRQGFTLIDMLLTISLLAVFMLMAFRLMRATVHTTTRTLLADDNAARFDRAIYALRADVSGSTSITMPQPTLLRIQRTDNKIIEWRTDSNSLARSIGTDRRSWDAGQPLHLKLDGAVVLIWANPADQIAMAP